MVTMLQILFPGLKDDSFQITSPPHKKYNCIAWALGDNSKWWWPHPKGTAHWPDDVPREETISAFQHLFVTNGYESCNDDQLEPGFTKIALFARDNEIPTHAAKQLTNGRWTSKLGRSEDIEHNLRDLEGQVYGAVVLLMKRLDTNQDKP